MRTLANILWHIPFLGFVNAFFTFLVGSFFVLTIVGAPIGLGMIQLSKFLLRPFSREMVDKSEVTDQQNKAWRAYSFIVRILYFPIGLALALFTIVQILALVVIIVGIPMAIVLSKSLGTFFNPVNKVSVSRNYKR